jgi:excinuclease ABC subunit C
MELRQKVKNLPAVPGVYKFKDSYGQIIYIGKAKNLKNRVRSYFSIKLDQDTKTFQLVQNIYDLEYIEVFSELEALILEARLIKEFRPKYNILLKDDKSYLYISIIDQKVQMEGKEIVLPQVMLTREKDLDEKNANFGPYTSSDAARTLFRTIRKVIPFRDCTDAKFERYKRIKRPCLYGFIGLCVAPCTNLDTYDIYKKNIAKVKKILNGESVLVMKELQKQMWMYSKEHKFEEAANARDMLKKFEYAQKTFRIPQAYVDNPYLVEDLLNKSLVELQTHIPILKNPPQVIECYDISNISGKEAVGSLVVAVDGRITKSRYRKFRIKLKDTPDDFGMLKEVLTRRIYKALKDPTDKWTLPDLFLIDGGKGQISTVLQVQEELGTNVPVIGIAKKQETLVYMENKTFKEVILPRTNEGLKLVQRLRDEAHRFAQAYHHKLRIKKIEES